MTNRETMRLWLAVAILACAGLYLIGNNSVPLWDRDEAWYAQCSRQMLQTGDWVVPRFLDDLRTEKPVLIYWLHLGSMSIFGPTPFAARLVSSLGMTLLLTVFGIVLFRTVGPRRAVWTVFILGTSVLIIAAAKMCLTDAVLLLWITITQLCILAIYRGKASWPIVLLMWVMIALGGLTKGPIVFVAPALTALMLMIFEAPRVLKSLTPWKWSFWNRMATILVALLAGVTILALIDGSWLYLLNQREPRWIPAVLKIAERHVKTAMEGHSGYPGTYLLWIWGTYFPWSLLLPMAAVMAWRHRHLPMIKFAIAAVVGPWIFQELMTTKLPHYVLPTFPFLAFLTADGLVRCIRGQYADLRDKPFLWAVGIWAVPVGLVASSIWLTTLPRFNFGPLPYAAMTALSIVGLLYTASVFYFFLTKRPAYAAACLGGGLIAVLAIFYGWFLPQADFMHLSTRTAAVLQAEGATAPNAKVGDVKTLIYKMDPTTTRDTIGYQEPSLPFYQGGTLRGEFRNNYLSEVPPEQWPKVMVLTNQIWDRTPKKIQAQLTILAKIHGLNYADGGKVVDIIVARKK